MSYVYQSSYLTIQERRRTPLGKVAAWLTNRAAGTFLQGTLSFLFQGSWVARVATGITVALLLGFIIDFSVKFFLSSPVGIIVCVVLGVVAGLAAQGAGGVALGSIWGWVIGGILDAITADLVSDPARRIGSVIVAWLVTVLVGWLIGLMVGWCFEKFTARHSRARRATQKLAIVIIIASLLVVIYEVVVWLMPDLALTSIVSDWLRPLM